MTFRRSLASLSLLAALPLAAGKARGQDIQWGNSSGGSFSTAANWIGGVVPGASDSVLFARTRSPNQPLSYTVSFGSSPSNLSLVVASDRVTLDLNANAYLLTGAGAVMSIGTSSVAPGRLTLIDGVVATTAPDANVLIGEGTNIAGFLTISTGAQLLGPSVFVGRIGPGTLVVQNGGDLVGGPLRVGWGATGTATVTGAGSAVVVEGLFLGSLGSGTLNVESGGQVESTSAFVGRAANALGTANVDGAGSRWTSSGELTVGETGPGALNVTNGGRVASGAGYVARSINGTGTVTIDGAGSRWTSSGAVNVGELGQGVLNITNGGQVGSTTASVGRFPAAVGTVNVEGIGSLWTNSGVMLIGDGGPGVLNITNGARVESGTGNLGLNSGVMGTVNVDGAGSLWTSSSDLRVGFNGLGELNIKNGARAHCAFSATAGYDPGGAGAITVDSNGELFALVCQVGGQSPGSMSVTGDGLVQSTTGLIGFVGSGSVFVGSGGRWICSSDLTLGNGALRSTLAIGANGQVRSTNGFIAMVSSSTSLVSVSGAGSRWEMTGFLSVGGNIAGGQNGGNGSITIGSGGTVSADRVYLYPGATVSLRGGTLEASSIVLAGVGSGGLLNLFSGVLQAGQVALNLLNQGAKLAPGPLAGRTLIDASYTQFPTASMEIEIGGTAPGTQFDQVTVSSTATLNGTLDVRLINGFLPSPGQTFVVLNAGVFIPEPGITGSFANAANGQRLAITGGGGSFIVNYGPGSPFGPDQVVLSGFSACRADFNGDDFLDFFDYLDYVNCFESNTCPPGKTADFNGDGFADFFDYIDYVTAFEAGC